MFKRMKEVRALSIAVGELYGFILELDHSPMKIEAYIVNPAAQKAARRALGVTDDGR